MDLFKSNYMDNDIDYIMSYMCKQDVKDSAKEYLLVNKLKISERLFLMSFYIYGYRQLLDIDNLHPIYVISGYVYNKFIDDKLTNEILMKYETTFIEWQRTSYNLLITDLLIQYFDIKKTIDNIIESKLDVDKLHLEKELLLVKERILSNNGEQILNKLSNKDISTVIVDLYNSKKNGFEYTGSQIDIIAKKAYWDCFEKENIADSLNNIKIIYKSIIPNRKDIHEVINNVIDIDFIIQQIQNTNYDYSNLITKIFDLIKIIDSSVGISQINKWLDNWNIIINYDLDISSVMPYVFRDIINKLEYIKLIANNITL